jgi:polar amino acid transport system substrate-binding protein
LWPGGRAGYDAEMMKAITATVLAALAHCCAANELVIAVSTGSAMPMTEFRDGLLVNGLLKEVGDAIAREMRLKPVYLILPRKRVEGAVTAGQADMLCDTRPEWLDGAFRWSVSVFSNDYIVASSGATPSISSLQALAGVRVGTILGYRYPQVERALGQRFLRDEALNDGVNLDKMLNRRHNFMLTNALYFEYQRKVHPRRDEINPLPYKFLQFDSYCALAPQGRYDLVDVNRAIVALRKRGELHAIMERFRPPR